MNLARPRAGLDAGDGAPVADGSKDDWLSRVRREIEQARQALELDRSRLLAERAALEEQIASLEHQMQVLSRLDAQSTMTEPAEASASPLSRRVLGLLRSSQRALTSRQLREMLKLNHRESRNLGPVLHQMRKSGLVTNKGRGLPWRLGSE